MTAATPKPDPADNEEHAFHQLLARLRAELGLPATPAPPPDAPPPPRPWSETEDEGA